MLYRLVTVGAVSFAAILGAAGNSSAQALKDVQTAQAPLVLKSQGSFFVGGRKVAQTEGELGNLGQEGTLPFTKCMCGIWCRREALTIRQS